MSPTFSIITPVYDPDPETLRATVASVLRQSFGAWQLCLVDDASPRPHVWPMLEEFARRDPRISIHRRETNGGISRASNDALAMATGEYVAFLDHDDILVKDALAIVNHGLVQAGGVDFCYSDEAKLFPDGRIGDAFYKPDWSPERMRSHMYTSHFSVMRRELVEEVGGLRPEFDGSQDHDLVLRVTEHTDRILHIAEMLYLWRIVPGSAAGAIDAKPAAFDAAVRAIQEHCDRVGIDAIVEMDELLGHYRVRRTVTEQPLVSIVIPTRGSDGVVNGEHRVHVLQAVESVLARSTYRNIELVVVADRSTPPAVIDRLESQAGGRLRLLWFDGPFNFSAKINAGVEVARGDLICLLNDDVEVIAADWLETMVGLAREADCGLVGAKLLFGDGTLQHGGHVYVNGSMLHAYTHFRGTDPGMANLLGVTRECAGVTAACAVLRREVWDQVGGMWEELPVNYNDVDFSLKIRSLGYRVVWTPHAVLHHHESSTRVPGTSPAEVSSIHRRWGQELACDPYFNPNLDKTRADWVVAKAPEAWIT